jgi:ribonuclease HI
MGILYLIAMILGLKRNEIIKLFQHWSAGSCGWKETKKFLTMGIRATNTVVYKTLGMLSNWAAIYPKKVDSKNKAKKNVMIHTPEGLPTGWFDGVAQSNGLQSGAGGLISLSSNSLIRWTFNCGPGTNTRAELLGAWATLHLASRLNIDELQIYGDSKIVIDWMNNKGKLQVISLLGWQDRIRELQPLFRKLSFTIYTESTTKKQIHFQKLLSKNQLVKSPITIGWMGKRAHLSSATSCERERTTSSTTSSGRTTSSISSWLAYL